MELDLDQWMVTMLTLVKFLWWSYFNGNDLVVSVYFKYADLERSLLVLSWILNGMFINCDLDIVMVLVD